MARGKITERIDAITGGRADRRVASTMFDVLRDT